MQTETSNQKFTDYQNNNNLHLRAKRLQNMIGDDLLTCIRLDLSTQQPKVELKYKKISRVAKFFLYKLLDNLS